MQNALQEELKQEVIMLWHKDSDLSMFSKEDCIVLPGGFSFGDYLRCGALARFSPMMEQVIEFANNGGKVLGVCNGFQILCEAGLLPGALLENDHQKFTCKNTYIKSVNENNLIGKSVKDAVLKIPIAHGEGRYLADEKTLEQLIQNNQIIFQYCNEAGEVSEDANPNGATYEIAGICNENRNVFGMMPHPERACSTSLGNTDGAVILKAMMQSI